MQPWQPREPSAVFTSISYLLPRSSGGAAMAERARALCVLAEPPEQQHQATVQTPPASASASVPAQQHKRAQEPERRITAGDERAFYRHVDTGMRSLAAPAEGIAGTRFEAAAVFSREYDHLWQENAAGGTQCVKLERDAGTMERQQDSSSLPEGVPPAHAVPDARAVPATCSAPIKAMFEVEHEHLLTVSPRSLGCRTIASPRSPAQPSVSSGSPARSSRWSLRSPRDARARSLAGALVVSPSTRPSGCKKGTSEPTVRSYACCLSAGSRAEVPPASPSRRITFSSSCVIEVECSLEELEQRQQWNVASKALRRKNKAQMRKAKQLERCMQERQRGLERGVAAMPQFLDPVLSDAFAIPSKHSRRAKNPLKLRIETTMALGVEESDSDELQQVARASLEHSEKCAQHHAPVSPALEVAIRNSLWTAGVDKVCDPPVCSTCSPHTESQPCMPRRRSILKPESQIHRWQRSTIWAHGIPEAVATEEALSIIFQAAFGQTTTVVVQRKSTEVYGPYRSWAFVTFVQPHAAARARLAGKLCVLPEVLELLSNQLMATPPANKVITDEPQQQQRRQQLEDEEKHEHEHEQEQEQEQEPQRDSQEQTQQQQQQQQQQVLQDQIQEQEKPVLLQLKEAKIPKDIDEQRRQRRRQRMYATQDECPSPLICGMDVPPCPQLARMWAEQQDQLDRVNANGCFDLYPDDDSPRQKVDRSCGHESSLRFHWSPKGFTSPVDSLLDELSSTVVSAVPNDTTPTGLVPLLARRRDSSQTAGGADEKVGGSTSDRTTVITLDH